MGLPPTGLPPMYWGMVEKEIQKPTVVQPPVEQALQQTMRQPIAPPKPQLLAQNDLYSTVQNDAQNELIYPLPYERFLEIRPYNNRTSQNESDWDLYKTRLVMGLPPKKHEQQFKKSNQNIKPTALVLHWTGDQYRKTYAGNFIKDEQGNKIEKDVNKLMDSMDDKKVHWIMTGVTGDTPQISETLAPQYKGGHVLGGITEVEQMDSFAQFPTNVSNKNALGIEVAYDPTLPGNEFSEKGREALQNFLITTMLQYNLSPKDLYAHGEIQKDRAGYNGEMVTFMKDFRKNLHKYLDDYGKKHGYKK